MRMNVASWTRDIGYEVCPVFTEPTPNSAAEERPYTLDGPEISVDIGATRLRAQIRTLREALDIFTQEDVERLRSLMPSELQQGVEWAVMDPWEDAKGFLLDLADRVDRVCAALAEGN